LLERPIALAIIFLLCLSLFGGKLAAMLNLKAKGSGRP
jgi:hypothetical protein